LLILLPPSEGKADAGTGRRLNLDGLSLPALREARERVLDTLHDLCVRDEQAALTTLGLSAGQLDEVRRNTRLREARTLPAARLYTGVLYDALDLGSLPPDAYALTKRSIVIFSGLWGAVRPADRIPPYRCSMSVSLSGLGGLGAFWRGALAGPLTELAGGGVVLDLRSSMYLPAWVPDGPLAERVVAVRVLHDGKVVSHFNKATKGRLVRDLALAGARPRTLRQLVGALRDLKYTLLEHPPVKGRPRRLDVIVSDIVPR
jgi:cytoplasmic iron level regulating protein YaaA (DUF328/UPF0246 family)